MLADECMCVRLCLFLFSYKSKSLGESNEIPLNEFCFSVCGIDSNSNRSGGIFEMTFELVDIIL